MSEVNKKPTHVRVPLKEWDGHKWAQLNLLALTHEICGETVKMKDGAYSFAGGHRVRLYSFKKNVHWKVPEGVSLDISGVEPGAAPRRRQG